MNIKDSVLHTESFYANKQKSEQLIVRFYKYQY